MKLTKLATLLLQYIGAANASAKEKADASASTHPSLRRAQNRDTVDIIVVLKDGEYRRKLKKDTRASGGLLPQDIAEEKKAKPLP